MDIPRRIASIRAAVERHLVAAERHALALQSEGHAILAIRADERVGEVQIVAPLPGVETTWRVSPNSYRAWHFANPDRDGVEVGGCYLDWPSAVAAGCPAAFAPAPAALPAPVVGGEGEGP